MSINGNFGLMVQIPEAVLQTFADAFVRQQASQFVFTLNRQLQLPGFDVSMASLFGVQLHSPRLTLVTPDEIDLSLQVVASGALQTRIAALPNGPAPSQPPEIDIALVGDITIRVRGVYIANGDKRSLYLDLRALDVTSFALGIDNQNISLPQPALDVLSAVVRRAAIAILVNRVGLIPISWSLGTTIPFLGNIGLQVNFYYKIVHSGSNRALALCLQVMGEAVDLNAVQYALAMPTDVGVFVDLAVIQFALRKLEHSLEGYPVKPGSGGIVGDLIFHDAHFSVQPPYFVIDEIKVQSRTLQKVEEVVERVICTALDPCNSWCRKVFETVIKWVQLDQLFHASGKARPYILNGQLRVEASDVDIDPSFPFAVLIFTGAEALIPLGGTIALILMVIGKILADKTVTGIVDQQSWGLVIDQPLEGTGLRVHAEAREIDWPSGCLALMSSVSLSRAAVT
ncbi:MULTISPECIES: hypothetical protein [unclassified Bradyrhizobium]|uniref:hypothetical protein n=1 Tax=unclassified Bradyrhizobium TaxID=2631580 RepID=UPI00291612CB|nr:MULTISPECIES: hypothetical protein [unclassified Bradyrhizobium]